MRRTAGERVVCQTTDWQLLGSQFVDGWPGNAQHRLPGCKGTPAFAQRHLGTWSAGSSQDLRGYRIRIHV